MRNIRHDFENMQKRQFDYARWLIRLKTKLKIPLCDFELSYVENSSPRSATKSPTAKSAHSDVRDF